MELNKIVLDTFQAISLILVFVTVLFNLRYNVIISEIENEKILTGELEIKREKKRLINFFLINCLPQLILNGMASYLFLPLSTRIIKSSNLSLWNFDFILTVFIFITLWIWIFFLWSIILGYKIINKIKVIEKELKNDALLRRYK